MTNAQSEQFHIGESTTLIIGLRSSKAALLQYAVNTYLSLGMAAGAAEFVVSNIW